jgi:hypothetical protein
MDTAIQQYRSERVSLWLFRRIALKQGLWDRLSYRIAPPHNFSQRPAAEPCDYERSWFHRARFSEWQESVKKFLADSRPTTAS